MSDEQLFGKSAPAEPLPRCTSPQSGWRPATTSTREPSRELPASAGSWNVSAGLGDIPDIPRSSVRSSLQTDTTCRDSSRRRVSSVSNRMGDVLSMIKEETSSLRAQHEEQVAKRIGLERDLKDARKDERQKARERSINQAARLQRRQKVTSHLQACVRGWIVRRRIVAAMDLTKVQSLKRAAMLPDLLRDQLEELQHDVHDLKYRSEEREAAAVQLQSWWRMLTACRFAKVLQLTRAIQSIGRRMEAAAIVVQAWYRGVSIKLKLRDEIRLRMEQSRQKQLRVMESALHSIIQIQRGFRAKLARGERLRFSVANERSKVSWKSAASKASSLPLTATRGSSCASTVGVEVPNLVDTWSPTSSLGAVAAGQGKAGIIIESLPQHDCELDKIASIDLVPFYGAASEEVVRHQIGGPTAMIMKQQLAIDSDCAAGDKSIVNINVATGDIDSVKELGDAWDVYPSGLTSGFLPSLDLDVWDRCSRRKSQRNSAQLRQNRRRSRRKKMECHTTVMAQPPPCNAAERAQSREARRFDSIGAQDGEVEADIHPMFINAPPLPATRAAPAARKARFFFTESDDEEPSWGETSAAHVPMYRTQRRARCQEEHDQWTSLNVPCDIEVRRHRPGEISHERVWSIAHALAEQLPALTVG